MTPEQIQQLIDYLRSIGEAAVTKGFELSLKQVYVHLAQNVFWSFFGLGLWATAFWAIRRAKAADAGGRWDMWSEQATYVVVAASGLIFGAMALLPSIHNVIGIAINPEWYAIQIMFGLVK